MPQVIKKYRVSRFPVCEVQVDSDLNDRTTDNLSKNKYEYIS